MVIVAQGEFSHPVGQGSYINVQVKYGLIKLINLRIDLCEQMQNLDEPCPLYGKKIITKAVDLPQEVPPVSSSVR